MNPQTAGIEELFGTYAFDLRTSHRALKLNRFLWSMIGKPARDAYLADEEASMTAAGLTDTEKALLRARDWLGLVQHGASFFVLEKFARVARMTNLEVYAIMRGETFEQFLATRRVPECR
jgi:Aromatic-ring-opening dioxygenase LigAB, LigA subunit